MKHLLSYDEFSLNESNEDGVRKSLERFVRGISQIGKLSTDRILDYIQHDIHTIRWKNMMGSHRTGLSEMIQKLRKLDLDGAIDALNSIEKSSYRNSVIPAFNSFMSGEPDFPTKGLHPENKRDPKLTPNGREKRKSV